MRLKAIVFPAKGHVTLWDELSLPELGPGDLEVRTTYSGVTAGTEKNLLTGGNYSPGFPVLPGYQQVGRIGRIGPAVVDWQVGQRVYAHFWGHPFIGPAHHGIGAHVAARVGPAGGNLIALPEEISDDEAALLSVASIGLHAVRRAGVGLGQRVLIFGLGIIGQFAAQAVRALGGRAIGVDPVAARLAWARQLGCEQTFDHGTPEVWEQLAAAGPFDAVIETTGLNDLVDAVLERALLVPRGSIVLVGGRFRVEYDFNRAQRLEAAILHTTHHENADSLEVIRLLQAGLWQIAPLITHRFRPEEAPDAWRLILGERPEWLGIVFDWTALAT